MAKKRKDVEVEDKPGSHGEIIARKDWHLYCPPKIDRKIKKGEDVSGVPEVFLKSLKTEGVI